MCTRHYQTITTSPSSPELKRYPQMVSEKVFPTGSSPALAKYIAIVSVHITISVCAHQRLFKLEHYQGKGRGEAVAFQTSIVLSEIPIACTTKKISEVGLTTNFLRYLQRFSCLIPILLYSTTGK